MKIHSEAAVEAQIQELRTITRLQGEPHTGDCLSALLQGGLPSCSPPRPPQWVKLTDGPAIRGELPGDLCISHNIGPMLEESRREVCLSLQELWTRQGCPIPGLGLTLFTRQQPSLERAGKLVKSRAGREERKMITKVMHFGEILSQSFLLVILFLHHRQNNAGRSRSRV